ncbi:MAG: DUF3604 domain-containing protein [Pseudomonadales bacterium]|nr:DUF3604 domain-containing protein [Pseudomonadales bacterium]
MSLCLTGILNGCKETPVPKVPTETHGPVIVDSGTYLDSQGVYREKRLDYSELRQPCSLYNPYRSPFIGDLHVHTERSLDAGIQDTRTSPAQAYQFAKGEPLGVQPWTAEGDSLRTVQLDRPLDFAMVSDHAEFFGETDVCRDPTSDGFNSAECTSFRKDPREKFVNWNLRYLGGLLQPKGALTRFEFCGEGAKDCLAAAIPVWQEMIDSAEAAYDRSDECGFTAFVGYEYTGAPLSFNLHRNIVFKNADVPGRPMSYMEYPRPENLWKALDEHCNENNNCEALTIPHNSNVSGDLLFRREKVAINYSDFDADYVRLRNKYEPLIEVFQHKGDSECSRTADELCGFEKFPFNNLIVDRYAGYLSGEPNDKSFIRTALKDGLALQQKYGVNPFEYGMVASTDTHLGTPGLVKESAYPGHGGAGADNGESVTGGLSDLISFSPGGLAILWAEENSRDYLFDAMQRREAQGTSGPRILMRMFAGWDLAQSNVCEGFYYDNAATALTQGNFIRVADQLGVPMGSKISSVPEAAKGKPIHIVVAAMRDTGYMSATEPEPGQPLQRLQVVKGWLDSDGNLHEKVFELESVATDPLGLNLNTCETTNSGSDAFCSVWVDPEFDPAQSAFYYSRAIEQPSCRWSWQQCLSLFENNPLAEFKQACADPQTMPKGYRDCCLHTHLADNYPNKFKKVQIGTYQPIIQERAWSSPIWYEAPR